MKEQEQEQEIELIKYNKVSWAKSFILGIFLGLGVIIPGISGSTIAIIFGLYAQLLFAFGNMCSFSTTYFFRNDCRRCRRFFTY